MRPVFDTDVSISAFVIPASLSDDAYRRARSGDVDPFTSVAILTELASKLRDKFDDRTLQAIIRSASHFLVDVAKAFVNSSRPTLIVLRAMRSSSGSAPTRWNVR